MRRREQLADVLRIDGLAAKASGELATASILAARPKGIETIEAATAFASKNPATVAAFEKSIEKVYYELNRAASGIYPCINSIFEKDRKYSSYTAESLDNSAQWLPRMAEPRDRAAPRPRMGEESKG